MFTLSKIPLRHFTLKIVFFGATDIVKLVKSKSIVKTFGINGSFSAPEKKFSIYFNKANTKFCLSLHYNSDKSYLFVNGGKEIFKFKAVYENVNFPTQFCLGSISNGFSYTESREVSLNGRVYDFSVHYSSTDKSDIMIIHKYLMTKNNIKSCSTCLFCC